MLNDTRKESLNSSDAAGAVKVFDCKASAPTTASTSSAQRVNLASGVVVLGHKAANFGDQADFVVGAETLVDGETLPAVIVAYYNPPTDRMAMMPVLGTSHTSPAVQADSVDYYPTDAAIEAALPETAEDYTVIAAACFKRVSSTITQYQDHAVRSFGVDPASKRVSVETY